MLDNYGFDLWADGYDKTVRISDEEDSYPFAGYKNLLNSIYNAVMGKLDPKSPAKILDIGIGTGTLACKLYEAGNLLISTKDVDLHPRSFPNGKLHNRPIPLCKSTKTMRIVSITGIDFSNEMLDISRAKMPNAKLLQHDFSKGLPSELNGEKFDFIISTYALHHLADSDKIEFILKLLSHLNDRGKIIIGDICFQNRESLNKCRINAGDDWDEDEFYVVYSELEAKLLQHCIVEYHKISHCAGILEIETQ